MPVPQSGTSDSPSGAKQAQDRVTAYICKNFTCQAPLVGVEAVEKTLKG
jgi:hypothetical protein